MSTRRDPDIDAPLAEPDPEVEYLLGGTPPAAQQPAPIDSGPFAPVAFARAYHWVLEREAIRRLREAGQPKPWTTDPILLENRFCNVLRQHDVVSRYIGAEMIDVQSILCETDKYSRIATGTGKAKNPYPGK